MLGNPLLLGDDGYQISRSVRLRSSASAYFSRTPASASNRQQWTWSGWCKVGTISVARALFSAGADGSNYTSIDWRADNRIQLYSNTAGIVVGSIVWDPMVFRDPTAWYHIVVVCDTPNATQTSRFRFYVNGVQFTTISSTPGENTWPAQNSNTNVNNTVAHSLGRKQHNASEYFDGYLTEINFIDGQALTPAAFGETDTITGVWKPKKYTGTYGTNGFYLNFSDNSNNTATTIGKDYSGNGNNWTPNNISVTSGATYDSMLDVPTPWADGGNGRGNYATMNPVGASGGVTFSNGSLRASVAQKAAPRYIAISTIAFTGVIYAEVTITPGGGPNPSPAIGIKNSNYKSFEGSATTAGQFAYGFRDSSAPNILKDENGSSSTLVAGGSMASGDVMMLAVDVAAGKMWLGKNGSWLASGNPATGSTPAISGFDATAAYWFFCATDQGTTTDNVFDWNFGQRPFAYTPPSGFKALHTGNLPEPTIKKGNAYFDATLWTGNGSNRSISNSGAMQPDLVWIKSRSIAGYYHVLTDSVRGTASQLFSNDTLAQETRTDRVTSFNSDGFSLGVKNDVNDNGATFVGWQWKEGATQGFDIVTYTGTGANRTVAHNLGVAPAMMIVKERGAVRNWGVYHASLGAASGIYLNLTNASASAATWWNSTAPTSSVFSVGTDDTTNRNTGTYVAYLFAEVAGFSKFGSYTGNGSTDGPFIHLGFRARFVVFKVASGTTGNWKMHDTARGTYNADHPELLAESSAAEGASTGLFDITANGIKLRTTSTNYNGSGNTYIFMAFAENPFKNALAR